MRNGFTPDVLIETSCAYVSRMKAEEKAWRVVGSTCECTRLGRLWPCMGRIFSFCNVTNKLDTKLTIVSYFPGCRPLQTWLYVMILSRIEKEWFNVAHWYSADDSECEKLNRMNIRQCTTFVWENNNASLASPAHELVGMFVAVRYWQKKPAPSLLLIPSLQSLFA